MRKKINAKLVFIIKKKKREKKRKNRKIGGKRQEGSG